MPSRAEVAAKHEALARGVAAGLSPAAARLAAGYKGDSEPNRVAGTAAFQERVDQLRDLLVWTDSFEPQPQIMELVDTARKAARLGNGAGMNAAAAIYAEVGRLKAELASRARQADDDAWAAKYGAPT